MSRTEVEPVEGTEGGGRPFFSPDGEWLGFLAGDKLKKVAVTGGIPVTILDGVVFTPAGGASWGHDDHIVLTTMTGYARVPSDGGGAIPIPGDDFGVGTLTAPATLPRGNGFLFSNLDLRSSLANGTIKILASNSSDPRDMLPGTHPMYSPATSQLFFIREGSLWSAPFDDARLELTGAPSAVATNIGGRYANRAYAVGGNGTLAYTPGARERRLVWVDRTGRIEPLNEPPASYLSPRIAPDGARVAVEFEGDRNIMVLDLRRGGRTRLTESFVGIPVWTPDGRGIASYGPNPDGSLNAVAIHPSDGSGGPSIVVTRDVIPIPGDWTPDGTTLVFHEIKSVANRDILLVTPPDDAVAYIATTANERTPSFSFDGRFIAYISDASGRDEVYVETFPERSDRVLVSTNGGIQPVWSPVAGELFYRRGNRLMSVSIESAPTLTASRPNVVFSGRFATGNLNNPNYAVSADGERFMMVEEDISKLGFHVILNAFE